MSSPGLLEAFGLADRGGPRAVTLIGGGGKTTLMFALARAAVAAGRRVVTTTTTRILVPAAGESDRVLTGSGAALLERLRAELASARHVTVAAERDDVRGKLTGLAPGEVDRIVTAGLADLVVVEADGSAGRPLKAHREHEPVVPATTDLAIAVVGADVVGAPLDEAHVHRAALFAERSGRPLGEPVGAEDVAAILLHRDGYLAHVAEGVAVALFVVATDAPALAAGWRIVAAVRGLDRAGRFARTVVGDARGGELHG